MSHLFGKEEYINNLREDVSNIQEHLIGMISRTGPQKFVSWKYPDKLGCDLDLSYLLEIYDYNSSCPEDSQLAHFILLELIIDRLMILMRFLSFYLLKDVNSSTNNSCLSSNVSLVCEQIIMVHNQNKQRNEEFQKLNQQLSELRSVNARLNKNLCTANTDSTISVSLNTTAYTKVPTASISRDDCNKSAQTYETAFIPCESCDRCQHCLRLVADEIQRICNQENIPAAMTQFRTDVRSNLNLKMSKMKVLTSNDIGRWTRVQCTDLRTLLEHVNKMRTSIDPLDLQLFDCKKEINNLNIKIQEHKKSMKLERETQSAQLRQFTHKIKKGEERESFKDNEIRSLEKEVRKLNECMRSNDLKLELINSEMKKSENVHNNLNEKMIIKDLNHKSEIDRITADNKVHLEFYQKEEVLKSKALENSLQRRIESLNEKQQTLVAKLETKRHQQDSTADKNSALSFELDRYKNELISVREKVHSYGDKENELKEIKLQSEKIKLKLKKATEDLENVTEKLSMEEKRTALLINYPELNRKSDDISSINRESLNIIDDMNNQMKSNDLRIETLQNENEKLRNSLDKLSRQPRVQLWTDSSEIKKSATIIDPKLTEDITEIDDFNSTWISDISEINDTYIHKDHLNFNESKTINDQFQVTDRTEDYTNLKNDTNSPKYRYAPTASVQPHDRRKPMSNVHIASDYNDPSASLGFDARKSFVIGRGRNSRSGNRTRHDNRPKFK